MESLSRPPHRRKHSSFSPYDDVVLLPKKAAAKPFDAREYAEIFSGSSSTTSIPVLDLSGLDERVGSLESGRLDYSSIFGGFRNDDVAVPYEELFSNGSAAKRTKTRTRPPKDPRSTLQESGSPSEKAKSSSVEASGQSIDGVKKQFNVSLDPRSTLQESGSPSEKAKSSSVEASGQSIDEVKKQFNVSFNKTSQINSDLTNGKTHIAQFHAVPGFTYFVDQTPRPQKKEDIKPVPSLKRGVSRTWSFSAEVETLKGKGGLHTPEKLHDVNEINLKPHPLSVPLPATCPVNPNDNKDPGGSRVSTFASKEDASLETVAEHSPPPLDEDLDENSVAGVSAAALKKAIEQAQESIRIAKMIMERKKGGLENGSKPRSKGCLKVEDKKETRVDREFYGTKEKNVQQKSERFDSVVPALSGFDGKFSRPLSINEKDINRGEVDVERVWENVDAAREHREPVGDDTKNVPSSSGSGTYRFAEKTEVEKQGRNVEAGTKHTVPFSSVVEKNSPSRSPSYADHCSEKAEFDKKQGENVKSVEALSETTDFTGLLATSELRVANSVSGQMVNNENLRLSMNSASLIVESGAGKEKSGQGEVTFHLAKIPEVVVQLARSTFQKMPTLRKSVTETSEQRQGAADHSQRAENVSELVEWVFSTTEIQPHQGKNMDEEYANMKISQEDEVIEEGKNAADDIEKHEKKIQEVEEMDNWEYARELRSEFNTSLHEPRNLIEKDILDQEKMTKKSDSVPDWKDNDLSNGLRYEEKENGMEQIVTHQGLESETQLEEDLKEQTVKKELKASPKTGEVEAEATTICEPEIDDRELSHDEDGPNLRVELEQIEKREPNNFGYAAVKGVDIEANSHTELQLDGEIRHMEEANHSPGGAVNSEHKHNECDIQEVTCEKNNDEAFASSGTDAATVCNDTHNNETSTMLYESQEAHSVNRPEELLKTFESFTADIGGVPEAFSANKDKGVEQLFPLGDIKMSETDCLRRSVSEENFVGSKLQNALEAFSFDRKKDNTGFMDANHEELQKNQDTFTNDGLHDVAMESRQNLPEIHPFNNTVEFHLTGVEQTSESEEGSVSISSTKNADSILANEYQGCEENANGETLNTREARDDIGTTSSERKCNEEQTDAVHSEGLSEGTDSEEQSEGGVESEELSEGVDNEKQSELVNYEDKSEGVNSEVQREESHSQSHSEPTEMDKSLETRSSLETGQNIEKTKENIIGTSTIAEKDAKENTDNFDKDGQQQRIEAIKRGREREKDRLAVERAIREARERAFAEARERAERAAVERAAAEARQRAMTEAREKLERASTEAKIRAERAAVERATSEARERAREKAMSQKATTDARTQTDRISTERYSSAARDNGLKHSLSSSDLDKYSEANTESAQRRNLRLERHQRIMERAAKALAEKNMRDLVAQKEQAERNRLAESLDTEIKRWASGKEGNLRALLSTLQYILGPDSGWQPISLTEIITTAAVKKAYRKATLYVHPDKLQQRGATIKQKYVCEKIFDLLKAAWNRFNSEER